MINVLATIKLKPGVRDQFVSIFNENVPAVLAENGCIEYFPATDVDAGLEVQSLDSDTVTVIEKWESLDALHVHLKAPHMTSYREKVKDMVEGVSLKVLAKS